MRIEAGKFYKTRDGRKVGPAVVDKRNTFMVGRWCYAEDGITSWTDNDEANTLISEWTDEPAQPAKTLRDEFALCVMPALWAKELGQTGIYKHVCDQSIRIVYNAAYEAADAMLKAREG